MPTQGFAPKFLSVKSFLSKRAQIWAGSSLLCAQSVSLLRLGCRKETNHDALGEERDGASCLAPTPRHPLRKPPRYPLRFQIFIQLLTWCQGTNLHQLFQKSDTTNRLRPEKSLQVFLLETNHRGIHELVELLSPVRPLLVPHLQRKQSVRAVWRARDVFACKVLF